MSNVSEKNKMAAEVANLLAGMKKQYTNGSQSLSLAGGSIIITVDGLESVFQGVLANRSAVVAAQATAKAKVAAENTQLLTALPLISGFTELVQFTYGSSAETLAQFTLAPRKTPAPRTAEQKAVAVAKAKATRKARAGAKTVTGNVTATLVVTPAAPAAAPAVAASSATAAKS